MHQPSHLLADLRSRPRPATTTQTRANRRLSLPSRNQSQLHINFLANGNNLFTAATQWPVSTPSQLHCQHTKIARSILGITSIHLWTQTIYKNHLIEVYTVPDRSSMQSRWPIYMINFRSRVRSDTMSARSLVRFDVA